MQSFTLIAFAAFLIVEMIVSAEGVDPSALQPETVLASDVKATATSQSGLRGSSKDVITAMNPALAERFGKLLRFALFCVNCSPSFVCSPKPLILNYEDGDVVLSMLNSVFQAEYF
jgi:hypothetical protein